MNQLGFLFNLATTYSRGSYTTTTIGNGAFDGRVRNGNGSGHPFRVTKKLLKNVSGVPQVRESGFSENYTQPSSSASYNVRELKSLVLR